MQKTPRRRLNLNMSGSSNDSSSCMEIEFLSGNNYIYKVVNTVETSKELEHL